jgi:aminoglycoside 3-N-acetyltransferase
LAANWHSRKELADDFRALGVSPGDVVMLHASVRAVGPVAGGPNEIHLALADALSAEGTLLMYTGCPRHYDEIGRGNLSPEQEGELREKMPAFDPFTAPSARDNGALVEFFRTFPGTRVNDHVTRFAAAGKDAEYLLSGQQWDFSYGHGSVLERFVQLGGKILLLGSDHDNVTFLHHVEHVVDIPGKIVVTYLVPVMENGRRVWREMKEFDTSERAHASWPDNFFSRIVDGYLSRSRNEGGMVGNARSHLIDAKDLSEYAAAVMQETARS